MPQILMILRMQVPLKYRHRHHLFEHYRRAMAAVLMTTLMHQYRSIFIIIRGHYYDENQR